jgi:hypothetical protein
MSQHGVIGMRMADRARDQRECKKGRGCIDKVANCM